MISLLSRAMKNSHRTWIEINADAFNQNIAALKNIIGNAALGIVLKGNAYGHGLELMGKLCQENNAVSWLFTAGTHEAIALRKQGVAKPILVLAYHDANHSTLHEYAIIAPINDLYTAHELSAAAKKSGVSIEAHIKIDTGMSRFGFLAAECEKFLNEIKNLNGLNITGIFTHLADTNNVDCSFTYDQLTRFNSAARCAQVVFGRHLFKHVLASGSLYLPTDYDGVRVGTSAYGYWKSGLQRQRYTAVSAGIQLTPILTWKTRIEAIKKINRGDTVGYHRTFMATDPMTIAILPVGYYDGYPRALSHRGTVRIRDTFCSVLGIISMNSMVVDVTHLANVNKDDEVILCGNFPGLDAESIAAVTHSLQNEFLARLSPAITRMIV